MDQLKLGLNRPATESLAQDLATCLVELDEIDAKRDGPAQALRRRKAFDTARAAVSADERHT